MLLKSKLDIQQQLCFLAIGLFHILNMRVYHITRVEVCKPAFICTMNMNESQITFTYCVKSLFLKLLSARFFNK